MSRRSKRRRMRETPPPQTAGAPPDAFDFQDDRVVPAVPQPPPAPEAAPPVAGPPRMASVPARGRTTSQAPVAHPVPVTAPVTTSAAATSSATSTAVVDAAPQSATPAVAPVVTPAEPPPLGALLTAGREARGLSIGEASARTRISSRMLENLENDRWDEFAADAYARGFLRNYATFLGLDVAMLLQRHEARRGHATPPAPEDEAWEAAVEASPEPPHAPRVQVSRRTWTIVAVTAGVAVLGGLGFLFASRGVLELRPSAGLEQIEHELRRTQEPVALPAAPPAADAAPAATPESPAGPSAVVGVAPGTAPATGLVGPRRDDAMPKVTPATPPTTFRGPEDTSSPVPALPAPGESVRPTTTAPRGVTESVRPTTTAPHLVAEAPRPTTVAASEPVETARPTAPSRRDATREPLSDLAPSDAQPSRPAPAIDAGPLVLTATALDTCAVRLQVDAEGKRAQRWAFSSRGESRSWTARRSFRLVVHRSQNLELRLNGRLVPVPADGRTVVLDHHTLGPVQQPVSTPKRTSGRRTRSRG